MERLAHGQKIRVKEKEVIGKDERTTQETVEKITLGEVVTVNGKDQYTFCYEF